MHKFWFISNIYVYVTTSLVGGGGKIIGTFHIQTNKETGKNIQMYLNIFEHNYAKREVILPHFYISLQL